MWTCSNGKDALTGKKESNVDAEQTLINVP